MRIVPQVDHPYAGVIHALIHNSFPAVVKTPCELLEALTGCLVGTKQQRFGPTPGPEALVSIREVLRDAIIRQDRIPVLVPWGGSKQGPFRVDIAEVMALKQINCLLAQVQQVYPPGIDLRIRLEDATDYILFEDDNQSKTATYTATMTRLVRILCDERMVSLNTETELMNFSEFRSQALDYAMDIMQTFGELPEKRAEILSVIGWSGGLPAAQIEHYRKVYQRFYPLLSSGERDFKIATYFGASLARYLRGAVALGASPNWQGKWITLSFTPPIPGQNPARRIFYRTIPERYTNQHRAPWIGKGYVRIRGNQAIPQIAGWDGDGLDFQPYEVLVGDDQLSATFSADFVVEE